MSAPPPVQIKIDSRETTLIDYCINVVKHNTFAEHVEIVATPLHVGDAIISCRADDSDAWVEKIIVERKTIPDLHASITDGRYEEQSLRLASYADNPRNIIYMIEAVPRPSFRLAGTRDRADDKHRTLYSALFSILYNKGFGVLQTESTADSAFALCCIAAKLVRDSARSSFSASMNAEYSSVLKPVKKDNITRDNIETIMLCCIPHVSAATANALLDHFGTLDNLIGHIRTDGTACLSAIKVATQSNPTKSRKLGQNVIKSVGRMFGSETELETG